MENVEKGLVRQCWRHLFSLMVLNLLTLAGCLPILTIPAALTVLRNSFLLLIRGCGFGTLLLSALLGAGMILLFPHSLPVLVLLGASLPAFVAAYGSLPALDALVVKKAWE